MHVEGDEILPELPRRNVVFLANHQTYFMEALAFFDLVYVRYQFPLEDPILRFSAAEETMKKNLLTALMTLVGGVTFKRSFRAGGVDVQRPVDLDGVERVQEAIQEGWLLHFPAGHHAKGCSPAGRGGAASAPDEGGGGARCAWTASGGSCFTSSCRASSSRACRSRTDRRTATAHSDRRTSSSSRPNAVLQGTRAAPGLLARTARARGTTTSATPHPPRTTPLPA